LALRGDASFRAAVRRQSGLALKRAELALTLEEERELVRAAAATVGGR
jgi:hypothetical protein